jgi:carbamoylphosphate synthase small subunit
VWSVRAVVLALASRARVSARSSSVDRRGSTEPELIAAKAVDLRRLVAALREAGNVTGAARLLGMGHTSLEEWIDADDALADLRTRR